MPRARTARKNGRPLKAVSKKLSPLQEKFVLYVLLDCSSKTKLKGYELAKKAGVTSAAISKWKKDPIILEAISNGASHYPELAAQVAEFRRAPEIIAEGIKSRHNAELAPFNKAYQELLNSEDKKYRDWLLNNWQRGGVLDEGMPAFETQEEVIEYLRKHKKVPREWLQKTLLLHPRWKKRKKM